MIFIYLFLNIMQVLSEERVTGTVTTELAPGQTQGRISYENRGECFFLPYGKDDVEGNVTLSVGDKVSFQIATSHRYFSSVECTLKRHNLTNDFFICVEAAVTWELATFVWRTLLIRCATKESSAP